MSIQPDTPALDVYGLASRLLSLVVDGFSSRDVSLPKLRYVAPGALPAYDTSQVTVNVNQIADGQAGGGTAASTGSFTTMQYADLTIAIVRDGVPVEAPTPGPSMRVLQTITQTHFLDVATLRAVLVDIREQDLLVDNATPFSLPTVRTEGPEGGVVAAVATVSVSLVQVQPWQ